MKAFQKNDSSRFELSDRTKLDIDNRENADENDGATQTVEPVPFLVSKGYECVDNREKGGALWVIGGRGISELIHNLSRRGFVYTFKLGGSKTTGYRDTWRRE